MKYLIFIGMIFLASCASVPSVDKEGEKVAQVDTETQQSDAEPPRHRKVYYFQHKLIPKWLFETEGVFFSDLSSGNGVRLFEVAEEIVDYEFSSNIDIQYIEKEKAVLFTFEKPDSPPNCYFAIARKTVEGYSYTTYESAMPFGDDVVGVVGGWNSDGDHLNMGPRGYKTAEEFVRDILGNENS